MSKSASLISPELISAFVELAKAGGFREAAQSLHLSQEGLRSRLLMLEYRLGTELYIKQRGRRTDVVLTRSGRLFLGKAARFLDEARKLVDSSERESAQRKLQIGSSQGVICYLLIDIVRAFRSEFPDVAIRLSAMTEQQIVDRLETDLELTFGVSTSTAFSTKLRYRSWFPMQWAFVAKKGHPLLRKRKVSLAEISAEPLIVFEPGCSGRHCILQAFFERGLTPNIAMETTATSNVLRMVEAGLGVSVLPLVPSMSMQDSAIGFAQLLDPMKAVDIGVLHPREMEFDPLARAFMTFMLDSYPVGRDSSNVVVIPTQLRTGRSRIAATNQRALPGDLQ